MEYFDQLFIQMVSKIRKKQLDPIERIDNE